MVGRRLPDGPDGATFAPGDYMKVTEGEQMQLGWFARPPRGHIGGLRKHTVTGHEDGTITVSPSILLTWGDATGDHTWHGYLERGVWREV